MTELCSHRVLRLDKTVSKFSVADSFRLVANFVYTADIENTKQDSLVLSLSGC